MSDSRVDIVIGFDIHLSGKIKMHLLKKNFIISLPSFILSFNSLIRSLLFFSFSFSLTKCNKRKEKKTIVSNSETLFLLSNDYNTRELLESVVLEAEPLTAKRTEL